MLNYNQGNEMTAKEIMDHEWEVDMFARQSAHQVKIKELDIQAEKLEATLSSWFKIPLYLIMLPVRILFVIPLSIFAITGREIPEQFWAFLRS